VIRRKRAAALLIVLGSLALLAALAVAFAHSSMYERRASQSFADRIRARMLAEAGIQRALGHMQSEAARQRWDSLEDDWVCADPPETALDALPHPSLASGTAHGRVYSGLLGADLSRPDPTRKRSRAGAYAVDGDQYVLRITDLSARLNLRYPDSAGQGNIRLLDNLCELLGIDIPAGSRLATAPRKNGFNDTDDLLALLDAPTRKKLSPYLTVHAWRDETALSTTPGGSAGQGSLSPTPHGRSPLNLNLAPLRLIQAALTRISATYLDASTRRVLTTEIGPRKAEQLAELLAARRKKRPFRNHDDLETFLAGQVGKTLTLAQASLVAVHANPDARLLKFNPDRVLFGSARMPRLFDRSDLVRYTTEFTFRHTGVLRIESLGRVIGPGKTVVARVQISTVARLHTQRRITSQREHLAAATLREGLTLHPESYGKGKRTSPLTGRIGLAAPRVPELAFFAKGNFDPVTASAPTPGGSARSTSVFAEGNRFADGYHATRRQRRDLSYPGEHLGVETGAVSFWWKPDNKAFEKTGGLFYADTPTGEKTGISTAVYYQRGMLTATRTYYLGYNGQPGDFRYDSRTPIIIRGKPHSDAHQRLSEYGGNWLRGHKPGGSYWHYKIYGDHFADLVLDGISKGKQHEVLYIYDVEKSTNLSHLGCITQYIRLSDYYPLVYQSGYRTHRQEVNTLSYLDVVDESGNPRFRGLMLDTPYPVSRTEKGAVIGGFEAHRWYHIRLTWTEGTDVRLFVDGVESRDHARYFGPLNPWTSRLTGPLNRFTIGAFKLERYTGESGALTPELGGKSLFVGTHGTFSGLSIAKTGGLRSPTPRYRASGRYEGRIASKPGQTLVGVSMASTAPPATSASCSLRTGKTWTALVSPSTRDWPASLALDGTKVAYRISLSATRGFPGKLSPFVDSLTFTWQHAPVIMARRER